MKKIDFNDVLYGVFITAMVIIIVFFCMILYELISREKTVQSYRIRARVQCVDMVRKTADFNIYVIGKGYQSQFDTTIYNIPIDKLDSVRDSEIRKAEAYVLFMEENINF